MKTDLLLKEINNVFPDIPMPAKSDLTVDKEDYQLFEEDVCKYFEAYRYKKIGDGILIRYLHNKLFLLSPYAYHWLLPHYLKYCLSLEWQYAQEPVYFLVYNLGPCPEFEKDAYCQLLTLSIEQINCLRHFLHWCNENEEYYDSEVDTDKAFAFLQKLLSKK